MTFAPRPTAAAEMGKDKKRKNEEKENEQDDPKKDTTGISFVQNSAVFSETNETMEWERPFADTGRQFRTKVNWNM